MAKIYSIPEEFEATISQFRREEKFDKLAVREKEWLESLRGDASEMSQGSMREKLYEKV